jgi:hypothetical protein
LPLLSGINQTSAAWPAAQHRGDFLHCKFSNQTSKEFHFYLFFKIK